MFTPPQKTNKQNKQLNLDKNKKNKTKANTKSERKKAYLSKSYQVKRKDEN